MIDMEKSQVLKSLNRFIISIFFALGVTFVTVAPFSIVNAESLSYYESTGEATSFCFMHNGSYETGFQAIDNVTVKCAVLGPENYRDNPSSMKFFYFSDTRDAEYYYMDITANNVTGRYRLNNWNEAAQVSWRVGTTSANTNTIFLDNFKINIVSNLSSMSNNDIFEYCMGIYEEIPSVTYGNIKDLSYSTNIVGSGTTTGDANIDTISWYPYWDTNSNISTTWNMEIQVVPGTWQGGTNTDIFNQTYQDFIINESGAMSIYHGTYLNGSYSISWGEVKNKLSILTWADLFQYFDGTYWNKKGWVYRARFNDPDNDYWSEWQTVYTVTSSAGEGVENYIDPSDGTGLPDFYNNAVDSYNTTSIVNNNTDITYYYVSTPVDTNPSNDDSTQYLKEIRDTIIQIRKMIAVDHNADAIPDNNNDPWSGNPAAELYDFENNSINDFNDAVNDLPTSDLVTGNKFLAASTWVRTQYEALVSNTPFEAVIIFSLLFGFGLLLIGKLR